MDDGRRHRENAAWYERREKNRENHRFDKERQRDIAWESRWTTSDDPNYVPEKEQEQEDPPKRDSRQAISIHPVMGWRACRWARKWRSAIFAILPSASDTAAPMTDLEVRKLGYLLWKDIVAWSAGTDAERVLGLFRTDHQTSKTFGWDSKAEAAASRGLEPGTPPGEWSFVPVSDLLLLVGEGIVGITAEGMFADKPGGYKRMSLAQCYKKSAAKLGDEPPPEEKAEPAGDARNGDGKLPSKWDRQRGAS